MNVEDITLTIFLLVIEEEIMSVINNCVYFNYFILGINDQNESNYQHTTKFINKSNDAKQKNQHDASKIRCFRKKFEKKVQ